MPVSVSGVSPASPPLSAIRPSGEVPYAKGDRRKVRPRELSGVGMVGAASILVVARTIAARTALGTKRQVFFVSLGGFDLHDNLLTQHPGLLTNVSEAISSFYAATVELGVAQQVTTFTASDFGRTLTSNGDGSDHGWGSHHFVVGGGVAGQQFFGTLPTLAVNGPDDVGQGRLLPTTSVDQLGAALATWFGVSATDLPLVLPHVGNFNLGTLPLFG